jgi:hypothetical protein
MVLEDSGQPVSDIGSRKVIFAPTPSALPGDHAHGRLVMIVRVRASKRTLRAKVRRI